MLDRFKKYFSASNADNPASADNNEEVEMTVEQKATADAMAAQLKEAQTTLTSQAADLEALTDLVAELSSKFEAAQAALSASEQSKADLVADTFAKKMVARKEKVTAIAGTIKAEEFMTTAEAFSDEQFDAVVGLMAASFDAEAKSPMFNEKGVAAEATPVEEDAVKRLAAKMAAAIQPA